MLDRECVDRCNGSRLSWGCLMYASHDMGTKSEDGVHVRITATTCPSSPSCPEVGGGWSARANTAGMACRACAVLMLIYSPCHSSHRRHDLLRSCAPNLRRLSCSPYVRRRREMYARHGCHGTQPPLLAPACHARAHSSPARAPAPGSACVAVIHSSSMVAPEPAPGFGPFGPVRLTTRQRMRPWMRKPA
jgi:hypothetical protein